MDNVLSMAKYVELNNRTYAMTEEESAQYDKLYSSTVRGWDLVEVDKPLVIDWFIYYRPEDSKIVLAFARYGFVLTSSLITGFLADEWTGDQNKFIDYGNDFRLKVSDFILGMSNAYEWLAENDKLELCGIARHDDGEEEEEDQDFDDENELD